MLSKNLTYNDLVEEIHERLENSKQVVVMSEKRFIVFHHREFCQEFMVDVEQVDNIYVDDLYAFLIEFVYTSEIIIVVNTENFKWDFEKFKAVMKERTVRKSR